MTVNAAEADSAAQYQLDISLVSDGTGRTYIGGQYVAYPFHLCRALRTLGDPEGMPTLYLQSCSGGLFEGEDLRCRIRVGRNARAHITTAASTIVHSMPSGMALQHTEIDVAADGFLEYLPDPLILFPDASLRNVVRLNLDPTAIAIVCDSFLAHDPKGASGVFRQFDSEMSLHRPDGQRLARDRYRVHGEHFARHTPGVMGSHRTQAGFVLAGKVGPEWIDGLRACVASHEAAYAGVSALPNAAGVWVRVLAPDAAIMRGVLASLWSRARELVTGVAPTARRK